MESSLWMLLSLGVSVLLLLSRATKRSSKSRGQRLPPGPTPLPVVGNLFELGNKPHRSLARLAKVYSPIMTLRLGRVNTVFVSSPEMAREILQKNDAVLSSRWIPEAVRVLAFNEASMVWLPPSQRWRNLRKICKTELFTTQRLDSYRSLRRQKVQELVQYISDSASKGLLVDVGRVAFSTTLNLISRTVFSADLVDLYRESSQEFKIVVEGILEEAGRANLSDYFPLLAKLDPQGIRHRSTKYFKKLHEIFDENIDRRLHRKRDGTTARNDFLDELLEHQVQGDGTKFDRQALKCFFSDIFVAGSDTTSSTVEWAMAELLRNPRRFEWRLPEGKEPRDLDMEEKFGVTLIMASPLKAMAVPTKCC
ncbi:hypothetical protein OPV22_010379 [Ensete ventricosum]|uniref:Cytochrome P450 n=1 Tax=Ensete ventricosum TaxID=4639 RepID=A0AAV8RGN8_ENSVE|nr:hypothetical protein OPV22_010379 [Ensete ventricosum]